MTGLFKLKIFKVDLENIYFSELEKLLDVCELKDISIYNIKTEISFNLDRCKFSILELERVHKLVYSINDNGVYLISHILPGIEYLKSKKVNDKINFLQIINEYKVICEFKDATIIDIKRYAVI